MRSRGVRFFLFPLLFYALCYFLLTFPLILQFNAEYFCDKGDGLQTIWNVWWVRTAVVQLHQSPWWTNLLHAPFGISLWLHSLSPINGFASIPLATLLSPIQTYNTLITLTFALSGLTMFWLAHEVTRRYWPSIAAGYGFAFCAFRFAHAPGHLHQLSTECLPLFAMLFLRLMKQGRRRDAIGAGLSLLGVLLCDQYQFLYCALVVATVFGWITIRAVVVLALRRHVTQAKELMLPDRSKAIALTTFAAISILLCGPILLATFAVARSSGPLIGNHYPASFAADLISPFVPGYAWHYHNLTRPLWQPVGSVNETSVSIGIGLMLIAVYGFFKTRRNVLGFSKIWLTLAISFTLLSFGPTLTLFDKPIFDFMPYDVLQALIPPLSQSGCPARMMIVTQMAVCVLAAVGLSSMESIPLPRRKLIYMFFVIAMVVESLPRLQFSVQPDIPAWATTMRDRKDGAAMIDMIDYGDEVSLFHQTIHGHPIAQGYLSRVPESLSDKGEAIVDDARAGRFEKLAAQGFRYVVTGAGTNIERLNLPTIFEDRSGRIYVLPEYP